METLINIANYIIEIIEYLVFIYFGASCIYVFVFALAGNFYKPIKCKQKQKQNKMAVLIPAYKEDKVIINVAITALVQNYPKDKFDVVVIADSLKEQTISTLKSLPIILIEVFFDKSTKSKALNKAITSLSNSYDYAIVLDADNIMELNFLRKMNQAFENEFQVVQGHRKAKNFNTSYAILDAASEEINNHIFRRGHRALGLSSGLIGSGMGFNYKLFKSLMANVYAIGGFDKELEFKLAESKIEIEYLQDAVVLDEKIQKPKDFTNQRRRWLSTQFIYLKKYFRSGWKELLLNRNFNFFDKVCQMIIPPRILLLGITFSITLIYSILVFVLNAKPNVNVYFWLANLIVTIASFLLAIPKSFYNTRTLKALLSIPSAFVRMTLLLFKLKGANQKFIHTIHGAIEK